MSNNAKNVNMEVPEDMVEQMRAYMERLQFATNVEMKEEKAEIEYEEGGDKTEVSRINSHRVKRNGTWQFEVVWKGYNRTRDWVDDCDCDCEKSISKYLKGKEIRTAYLFCRVSTKEQATSVNVSLEAQEEELRAAVRGMAGFTRIRVYSISQSAYKNIPKALQRIGEAALKDDGILVWRVDRLSRNIVTYLAWMEDLNERGVMLYSHQESMTYENKKLSFLQGVLDGQKESALLGERIKLSYRRKRARGDERVGGLPYGKKYQRILTQDKKSTVRKIVVDHPHEILFINRIRKSKKNAVRLAQELNDKGFKKRGRKWNRMMILRIQRYR